MKRKKEKSGEKPVEYATKEGMHLIHLFYVLEILFHLRACFHFFFCLSKLYGRRSKCPCNALAYRYTLHASLKMFSQSEYCSKVEIKS